MILSFCWQVLNEPGRRYNSQLMNAVVLYVGTQAIALIRAKGQTPNMSTIAHSAHMDIFQNFTVDFDFEGRSVYMYIFLFIYIALPMNIYSYVLSDI